MLHNTSHQSNVVISIRQALCAKPAHSFVAADYSQVGIVASRTCSCFCLLAFNPAHCELLTPRIDVLNAQIEIRILAHMSNDRHLREFLRSGRDVHRMIASHWLMKAAESVTDMERVHAKRIVFGIVYGIGTQSLSKLLSVPYEQAAEFRRSFLDRFPGRLEHLENRRSRM